LEPSNGMSGERSAHATTERVEDQASSTGL